MIVNRSMFPLQQSFNTISKMQSQLEMLQLQLGTGKRNHTLADFGDKRMFDLQMRARLSRIEGYTQTGDTVTVRLDVLDTAMARMDELETEAQSDAAAGQFGAEALTLANLPSLSAARMDELVALLNTNSVGRYLFGGTIADRQPVKNMDVLLEGEGARAGFRQVANERKLADLGADGLGRLDLSRVAEVVTLAEDGAHPFGLKLSSVATTSTGVTLAGPAGAPPSLDVSFTGPVTEGETVSVTVALPDGATATIALRATDDAINPSDFEIGATDADTAANFQAVLQANIETLGDTKLVAASTFVAAESFFNASGETRMRVDGPPFESATALVAATDADTVTWYQGSDENPPRTAVTAKVDDTTTVRYGVQANETGFVTLMRSLAALAIEDYPANDPNAEDRFNALAARQASALSNGHDAEAGSIELVTLDLGIARSSIGAAEERHKATKLQLDTMLSEIEGVSIEEVALELLALKTRLEASYRTTAAVSQLSLVNYLPL
jgi:flagellar hook-associated protein 3 FlgL